ncbi:WD domain, G-beta repeat-containing protein [Cardiosporidium cionae]|uniref:WD domain, G-beta repeat-containing protein n=1 Tax=Cardiosporidium cionae TaxID=476202 RepID=A0ABQ7JGL3_9APIC|nr:WD domain, G-beta repeat-containing protein [Cardiosporidium cionae]|eukprot:KAF8823098.1 WD domain, G-beta repeat-containing protein [Cardiosporidium cionae]
MSGFEFISLGMEINQQSSCDESSNPQDHNAQLQAAGFPISFGKASNGHFGDCLPPILKSNSSASLQDGNLTSHRTFPSKRAGNEIVQIHESIRDKCETVADQDALSKRSNLSLPTKVDMAKPLFGIPSAYEVSIPSHSKMVTALTVNPKASRMITGGMDFQMRLWDFNGMTSSMCSFRQLEPNEGHALQGLDYAANGSHFVCAAGGTTCLLYDLNANLLHETVKGDMYIRDMGQTKGHTHMVTDCQFHPFNRDIFMSSAMDATVRIWDLNSSPYGVDRALSHMHCLKAVDRRNMNISQCHVLCCTWAPTDARCIVGGCVDGSLQIWNEKKQYGKPDRVLRSAHGNEITCVRFFDDNQKFLSRSLDDSMKLWDIRKLTPNAAIHTWTGLVTVSTKTNIALSPDAKLILTSTQGSKANPCGSLHFFDSETFDSVKVVNFDKASPICVTWPSEINQLICGCNDGTVRMLYDPSLSQKGALLFVNRTAGRKHDDVATFNPPVFTMDTLPAGYKETRSGMVRKVKPRGKEKERIEQETMKALIPPRPTGKEGSGGILASHRNLSQMILGQLGKSSIQDEDPTEVLRGYASAAEANPLLVGSAYKRTQPQPILDYSMEENDEEALLSNAEKCPRCGLKMCQCGYMAHQNSISGPSSKIQRTS